MKDRITDPLKVPVQMNVKVPFEYREFLHRKAHKEGISLNKLVTEVLMSACPMTKGLDEGG